MPGFDITSILDFRPSGYVCPRCRVLFDSLNVVSDKSPGLSVWRYFCPACQSEFVKVSWSQESNVYTYLKQTGNTIEHGRDLFEHARALAALIRDSRQGEAWEGPWPTMRTFFEVLARARHFVHFASWRISHLMIGALKARRGHGMRRTKNSSLLMNCSHLRVPQILPAKL